MIISKKKKFERLVEDEVCKRLIEIEEKQKERKRLLENEDRLTKVECMVYDVRDDVKKLRECVVNSKAFEYYKT